MGIATMKMHLTSLQESSDPFPVDLDEVWKKMGYFKKQNAVEILTRNFKGGEDYFLLEKVKSPVGRPRNAFKLSSDTFEDLCLMSQTEIGRLTRKAYRTFRKDLETIVGRDVIQEQLKGILLDKPMDWVKTFPKSFFKAAMAVYGYSYNENAPHQSPGIIRSISSRFG